MAESLVGESWDEKSDVVTLYSPENGADSIRTCHFFVRHNGINNMETERQ